MSPLLARSVAYLSLLACMVFLEAHYPFARSSQKKSFRIVFHFGIGLLNSLILYLVLFPVLSAAVRYASVCPYGLTHIFGLSGWTEILVTLVVFDFWDYWMHRANHGVGFLWRFHRAHHSDMEIDVTTASRFHIGELLITNSVKGALILLWGPSLWGLATFETLLTATSQFHHSNLGIPLKAQDGLEKIIVSPRMHRCHHVFEGMCAASNYATVFSLWDRLFATYHRTAKTTELEAIGMARPRGPETMKLLPLLVTPFAHY